MKFFAGKDYSAGIVETADGYNASYCDRRDQG
eukprot:SAG11_NODE_24899_length_366_cov_1.161049_1_plen_31_part_01